MTFVACETRWHAVASWTWDAHDETCGICRMAFDGCCPDCKLPVHREMGKFSNSSSSLPHVPEGMAFQRIKLSKVEEDSPSI
ncbi:hypothetical protein CUMW_289590 [Citrus unshiu]|uniref:Anaphase-promoting complex subunit 11 RING-H2 finger domain-containing protein n=1 Tax=Citrus unshiu TaxID=55188 RepID=A0A2H5QZE1_CITUN|nr:hypothetical protein CUMW_289590 [Citrus unshiu]